MRSALSSARVRIDATSTAWRSNSLTGISLRSLLSVGQCGGANGSFTSRHCTRSGVREPGLIERVIVNPSFPVGPRDIKQTPTGKVILDFLNRRIPAY